MAFHSPARPITLDEELSAVAPAIYLYLSVFVFALHPHSPEKWQAYTTVREISKGTRPASGLLRDRSRAGRFA
jgi:hypothetical protein